jgi:hypothetical protein
MLATVEKKISPKNPHFKTAVAKSVKKDKFSCRIYHRQINIV